LVGFSEQKISFTAWDVGGCDKIRPLWRHYFEGTQAVVFVLDSNDKERLAEAWSIYLMMEEPVIKYVPVIFVANKQDLPGARSVSQLTDDLKLNEIKERDWYIQSACATSGDGLQEILDWLCRSVQKGPRKVPDTSVPEVKQEEIKKEKREKSLLELWLEVEDEPDEEFLEKLTNYSLESWDHRTHLRIAWLYLTKLGRREGMKLIFSGIKNFIEHSERTRKTTFHETLTYFW
jgi:signal recognition particle receptor subunit beta